MERLEPTEKSKTDWVGLIILLVIVVGAVIVSYSLITERINKCTSNPLRYTLELYSYKDNYTFGETYLYLNKGDTVASKIIEFPEPIKIKEISFILKNLTKNPS